MAKKVIFVIETRFSGSTFFHLTLANDPKGFAVGEVKSLFRPTRAHHRRSVRSCQCGDPSCDLWDRAEKNGMDRLYESIFDIHPEVDFIVDSNKDILWTQHHTSRLAKQGIEVKIILIWKTLIEYAHSLQKRSYPLENDLPLWIRFHRNFYSFFNHFGALKYKNYTENHKTTLQETCNYLGIPYFEGKEQYWEKKHHSLRGNSSAKLHQYSKDSPGYQKVVQRSSGGVHGTDISVSEEHHRTIFYDNPNEKLLNHYIDEVRKKYPNSDQIEEMLISRDIGNPGNWNKPWPDLQRSELEMQVIRAYKTIREYSQYLHFKMRYAD